MFEPWFVIEKMGKLFNDPFIPPSQGYKNASHYLVHESGLSRWELKELISYVGDRVNNLYSYLDDVQIGSDDGYNDLCWQIVSNGREFYDNITPEKMQQMVNENNYTESFAYAFTSAQDIVDLEIRLDRDEKYIEEAYKGDLHGSFMHALAVAWYKADQNNKTKICSQWPGVFRLVGIHRWNIDPKNIDKCCCQH